MEDEFLCIYVEYKFPSFLGTHEESDHIKEYKGIFYSEGNASNTKAEYIGEIEFKIICLQQAENAGLDIYQMFDTYEYTHRHGQDFYDFKENTFKKAILKEFPDLEFGCSRICIIETIGIIPKFRGKNLGPKLFKDLVWNMGSDCGLFIIQPYPLQFELTRNNPELLPVLQLNNMEQNKKKATKSLTNYYLTWGFKKIKTIKDLLFYSPFHSNDQFDSIDMDDY